jgi:hypothetical protein
MAGKKGGPYRDYKRGCPRCPHTKKIQRDPTGAEHEKNIINRRCDDDD